jgi:hypothetical protein
MCIPLQESRQNRERYRLRGSFGNSRERRESVMLPFELSVPVRSYVDQAFGLSVITARGLQLTSFPEYFVQVFFPDNKLEYDRVLMLPKLGIDELARLGELEIVEPDIESDQYADPELLVEYLGCAISDGFYVEINIDEFYIPGRPCFGKIHSVHDNMLIGQDRALGQFQIVGYGADYEAVPVGYGVIADAFQRVPWDQLAKRRLRFIRPTESGRAQRGALGRTISYLKDYVGSTASFSPAEMKSANLYWRNRRFTGTWGLDTYGAFEAYMDCAAQKKEKLDLRATRTLWEHKVCMRGRIELLEKECLAQSAAPLSSAYVAVEKMARLIRFQAYDYNVSEGKLDMMSVSGQLSRMREAEKSVLTALQDSLERNGYTDSK